MVIYFAGGVVRIAQPEHFAVALFVWFYIDDGGGAGIHVAGIFIFAECRSGNDGLSAEGLSNEIDGFSCSVGDDDLFGVYAVPFCYHCLERPCFGFGVVVDEFGVSGEVSHQCVMAVVNTNIR